MPAHYVKPYIKTNKNDDIDGEAIAEAVTRHTMRFVTADHETPDEFASLPRGF